MSDAASLKIENAYGAMGSLRKVFFVAALTYPFWYFATPSSAVDSAWVWWAVAGVFLVVIGASYRIPAVQRNLAPLLHLCAWLCALQLYVLASINDMHPFYAVGSVMSVLSTAMSIRDKWSLIAFGVFVFGLSVTLFLVEPNLRKIAYWGGILPVVCAAYYRLDARLTAARLTNEHQERLEQQVNERTSELSASNRRLHQEIKERSLLEEELRIAQKLDALGQLAGGIAHEFNNLLTRIRLYAELAVETVDANSPVRTEIGEIQKAGRQASKLTEQLLTFSRRGQMQTEVLDLNEVVRDACTMLRHLLGEDIDLRVRVDDPSKCCIEADRGSLEQILVNLALNARDAMPAGGTLTFETALLEPGDLVEEELPERLYNGPLVSLYVSDTGVGMDAETRARAFDPFFTRKQVGEGTGLGLSVVYGIVRNTGGYIGLMSHPGQGTRFKIYWSFSSGRPVPETPGETHPVHRGDERILLVEDEPALRSALRRLLEASGYNVLEAEHGAAALEILTSFEGKIDLLLADVVMPRMGGIELVERLAVLQPKTRVLLISGNLDHPAIRNLKLPAGVALLRKPFDGECLTSRVREILVDETVSNERGG